MNAKTHDLPYDLVVIGGGIHGAGVARDAALRGLRVALFERDDFASGTSSASSKLVHGGLRYLEQFRFGLVRESLVERDTLRRIAPHLVRPLPFLAPIYDDGPRGRRWMGAGLWLYDLLAAGHSLGRHRWLDARTALEREPGLREEGLRGAFLFYDAQMDDARLCLENVLDARAHGARVCNRAEVKALVVEHGRVQGVDVEIEGRRERIAARVVVNATGPWVAALSSGQSLAEPVRARFSRGTHVVTRPLTRGHALLLSARSDGRVFFVLPFKGRSLIGTTDIEIDRVPRHVDPTEEEITYLLDEANRRLSGPALGRDDVLFAFAGVRALRDHGASSVGSSDRRADLVDDAPGLLSIVGGKYTTYRAVAERAVDAALRRIGRASQRCETAERVLPGGDAPAMNDYFEVAERVLLKKYDRLEVGVLRYLLGTYGSRHLAVLRLMDDDPAASERIEPGLPFTAAEVEFAVRHEMARSLDDVLRRRCYRAYLGDLGPSEHEAWQRAFDRALERQRVRPAPH